MTSINNRERAFHPVICLMSGTNKQQCRSLNWNGIVKMSAVGEKVHEGNLFEVISYELIQLRCLEIRLHLGIVKRACSALGLTVVFFLLVRQNPNKFVFSSYFVRQLHGFYELPCEWCGLLFYAYRLWLLSLVADAVLLRFLLVNGLLYKKKSITDVSNRFLGGYWFFPCILYLYKVDRVSPLLHRFRRFHGQQVSCRYSCR